eukprot:1189727-Prorocentrum_minimum.AAC.5
MLHQQTRVTSSKSAADLRDLRAPDEAEIPPQTAVPKIARAALADASFAGAAYVGAEAPAEAGRHLYVSPDDGSNSAVHGGNRVGSCLRCGPDML